MFFPFTFIVGFTHEIYSEVYYEYEKKEHYFLFCYALGILKNFSPKTKEL